MIRLPLLLSALALLPASVSAQNTWHGPDQQTLQVSPQGLFVAPSLANHQGEHGWTLQVTPVAADLTYMQSDLRLESDTGEVFLLPHIDGTGFLISKFGQVVITEATHSDAVPVQLRVLSPDGQLQLEEEILGLSSPVLSADGDQLAFRTRQSTALLDFKTLTITHYPRYASFAVAEDGTVAGVVIDTEEIQLHDNKGNSIKVAIPAAPKRLAFSTEGDLLVLTSQSLFRIDGQLGKLEPLFALQPLGELRDLRVHQGMIHIGSRRTQGNGFRGNHLLLNGQGKFLGQLHNSTTSIPPPGHQANPQKRGFIPWPLAPNSQHPIGNTYGEYQNYGGSPYLHPGIDVLGNSYQPVYAVADGVVKAVLTTSGQYHWRVAIGGPGNGTTSGHLYAHLQQSSITVDVGDAVVKGQYLGDLVPWPTSGFTHCHFNSIEDSGNQWFGDWLCPDNVHEDLVRCLETSAPVFENARGNELFAFCRNETSTYRDPNNLQGKVDIIAHVGDRLDSNWTCGIQTLRYSIYPSGNPGAPIVDNKLSFNFDMILDTYGSGTIDSFLVDLIYKEDSTCNTNGDYNSREFFYVITNSDGDQTYNAADQSESWNTVNVANGDYVVEVVARDVAGNQSVASMTVTVNN